MLSQPRIHVLSDHVANKIAAGEVVDRPASVLKELMENALDAGATQIDVSIGGGGKRIISITDNGCGMDRDNVLLSVERHATSKIRDVDDIESVATLGFRGEALAAIASVSRFTLISRSADQLEGTELHITGGKMAEVKDAGCPPGTTFHIRNLFFNVPARRKFLRTEPTELTHIRQTFLVYALSHPSVGMTLTVDDRPAYSLAAGAALGERLTELFGRDILSTLLPVESTGEVRVRGYVGRPHAHRADRSEQFIFVNGRPASAPLVGFALNEAYHTLIPKGRYPSIFLFIDMPPDGVDVNVHPTKKEVRFRHPDAVRDTLITSLRKVLTQPTEAGTEERIMPAMPEGPRLRIEDLPAMPMFNYPKLEPVIEGEPLPSRPKPEEPGAPATESDSGPWSWCRVLGQVGGLYVVMETEDGLVLMDPHAAHERLLFEKFMREAMARKVRSQGLLAPETVELTPADAALVRKQMPLLEAMGFGLSEFGGDTFIIDALPVCLGSVSGQSVLVAVAESLEQSGERGGTPHWAEEKVARAACRAAVKARDRLTVQEIERLVIDLARAEMPYTCPHGRPTLIFMGFKELDKKFGRI
jgi:DNA mismatch repair protein MutL